MPATRERLIAVNLQRQSIPRHLLIDFDQQTNEALASLSQDAIVNSDVRTFAGWELEYREANDIFVDYDPATWELRRSILRREEDFARQAGEDAKASKVDRSHYSVEATNARIRAAMRRGNGEMPSR